MDDVVLVGNENGELYAFRHQDGTKAWSHQVGGVLRCFNIADSVLYLGTLKGLIHAIELDKGS